MKHAPCAAACVAANAGIEEIPNEFLRDKLLRRLKEDVEPIGGSNDDAVESATVWWEDCSWSSKTELSIRLGGWTLITN